MNYDDAKNFDRDDTDVPVVEISDRDARDDLLSLNKELMKENARLLEIIASRDAFLAIVGHELRNPMTPIVARITLLRRMIVKPDITLENIGESFEKLEWLISRYVQRTTTLLDISRLSSGKFTYDPTLVNVCGLIREVVESVRPLAEHNGAPITVDLPSEGLTIPSDRLSLEQIIDNLLSNAIKYGAGTPISMSVTTDTENEVAVIQVRDRGPGIAHADQTRIFERFERAEYRGGQAGFGVGLWIVRELTAALGGDVTLHSEPGAGSAFTVTIPLKTAKDTK